MNAAGFRRKQITAKTCRAIGLAEAEGTKNAKKREQGRKADRELTRIKNEPRPSAVRFCFAACPP
jgi:hypothetical protein